MYPNLSVQRSNDLLSVRLHNRQNDLSSNRLANFFVQIPILFNAFCAVIHHRIATFALVVVIIGTTDLVVDTDQVDDKKQVIVDVAFHMFVEVVALVES